MEMDNPTARRWLDKHREQVVDGNTVEVEVFVRSLSPPLGARQRQEQLLKQLQELSERDRIDSYRVNLWGGGVCLCDVCSGTSAARSMLDSIDKFEQWATSEGDVSLPFERRSVDSTMLDQSSTDLVVPSLCLSVTAGTDLCGVFPCTVAGEDISVTDYVEMLSSTETVETETGESQDPIAQI